MPQRSPCYPPINNPLLPAVVGACLFGVIIAARVSAQSFKMLYSFTALDSTGTNCDGAGPAAGLVLASDTLFGTAYIGGDFGFGTVFSLSTNGSNFTTWFSFTGASDGASPGGLILSGNELFGTAATGGNSTNGTVAGGSGTVFILNIDLTILQTLYDFSALPLSAPYVNNDGANPRGLTVSAGRLYGTAGTGGSSGSGTFFVMNTDGTGFTNLYSFSTGSGPSAALLSSTTLYGTQAGSGALGGGSVFRLNTTGTGFKALHSFGSTTNLHGTNSDGANPSGSLVLSGNTLFGTTTSGGNSGDGTVFKITTDGTGFQVLYCFTALSNAAGTGTNSDGAGPGRLILSSNTLYGTTAAGGSSGNGTVFQLNTDGTGFKVLYSFTGTPSSAPDTNSDGANPSGQLVLAGNTLYGTASSGGLSGSGTVFSISLPVTPPQLTITPAGGNVILSWLTNATGFTLQSTTNLVSPAVWTAVSAGPAIVNGKNTVTNPIASTQEFYRLSQ